ncbi:hypothetical protein PHMEG_0001610 [Phytophthora megakarya]|uniref:Uncharacterized protein n=1 Tax=Phytophthora megakarya TaxID=4795 RepID=A0A225X0U5_9STRA|nr:hypothetical protein PHMEG_0001610 [Phytophthora megakarya]
MADHLLMDSTLEDHGQLGTRRKREDDNETQKRRVVSKQRRHNWQPKYEMEYGLLVIERDVSGDVLLAMCGFCKAFGREDKYEQLVQQDQETGNDKKRRRRSLTTTKFFRAFRVDNIRSHLQGSHPRRWAEYEILPKQDNIRARYLQLQGEIQTYDHLPMDDVVLGASALTAEADIGYAQSQLAQASAISEAHAAAQIAVQVHNVQTSGTSQSSTTQTASLVNFRDESKQHNADGIFGSGASSASGSASTRSTHFDYEKHLTEQIALDRERLDFEKMRFEREVELRERELALREKHMQQKIVLQEKLCEANRENAQLESAKFYRLAEVLRDAITGAQSSSESPSVV